MCRFLLTLTLLAVMAGASAQSPPRHVILDVHMHAGPAGWSGPGAPSDATNDKRLRSVLAEMDRHNVKLAVISGPMDFVEYWKKQAPDRFVASVMFPCIGSAAPLGGRQCFASGSSVPDLGWLRNGYTSGAFGAMGEITAQYAGLSPADASLEPYLALAEELDVPVGIHTGVSYPGTPYQCCPKFRAALGRPLLLEEVLIRHPKLRVNAMHAGYPYAEEMVAVMAIYPQLHVDISAIGCLMPSESFHVYLRTLIENEFGKRILFGSDNFPLADCIESIDSATFLSEEQKSDIFCRNAARFLRLDEGATCSKEGA